MNSTFAQIWNELAERTDPVKHDPREVQQYVEGLEPQQIQEIRQRLNILNNVFQNQAQTQATRQQS